MEKRIFSWAKGESGYKVLKTPGLGCLHLPAQIFYETNLIKLVNQVKEERKTRLQGLNEKNLRWTSLCVYNLLISEEQDLFFSLLKRNCGFSALSLRPFR